MANTPFSSGSSNAAMYDDSRSGGNASPDFTQGGAPAGKTFSNAELPVEAVHGGSGMKEGFSPSPARTPFIPAGSDVGSPLPPSGSRR